MGFARTMRWMVVLGLAAGVLGCADHPAWSARNPGSGCIDPCGAMGCPTGTHCVYNGQCQPRCDVDPRPGSWKP